MIIASLMRPFLLMSASLALILLLVSRPAHSMATSFIDGPIRSGTPADSLKRQPVKHRTASVQPAKHTNEAQYSAPGHYTITVPAINGPGGKADLILVNGTKQVERIGDVDSNDIESIQVFKDARTIAKYRVQYGEKADKGVVIIQLKHKTS